MNVNEVVAILGALQPYALTSIAAISGLFGVYLKFRHDDKQDEHKRKLDLKKEQVSKFYGPAYHLMQKFETQWKLHKSVLARMQQPAKQDNRGELKQMRADIRGYFSMAIREEAKIFEEILELFKVNAHLIEPATGRYLRFLQRYVANQKVLEQFNLDQTYTREDTYITSQKLDEFLRHVGDFCPTLQNQFARGDSGPLVVKTITQEEIEAMMGPALPECPVYAPTIADANKETELVPQS